MVDGGGEVVATKGLLAFPLPLRDRIRKVARPPTKTIAMMMKGKYRFIDCLGSFVFSKMQLHNLFGT